MKGIDLFAGGGDLPKVRKRPASKSSGRQITIQSLSNTTSAIIQTRFTSARICIKRIGHSYHRMT